MVGVSFYFLFGSMMSATDPAAVVAVLQEVCLFVCLGVCVCVCACCGSVVVVGSGSVVWSHARTTHN